MKQELDSSIPSPAPTVQDVSVRVLLNDSGITVNPDCVLVDATKRVIWRFVVPEGKTLDPESVRFNFDRNRDWGPFAGIERVGDSNDWISTGTGSEERHRGYHTYNIAARVVSPAGAVDLVVDPVIYNYGDPPR